MRKVIAALVFVCSSVAAAEVPVKEIDAVFAEWSGTSTPGCALTLLQNDVPVLTRTYGMANLEHHVAISEDSVFGIQSTSKQFTAMAIILLVQDGKLRFDDDIRKFLPEIPSYGAVITVRHLLEHSSGLRDIGILIQDQGLPAGQDLSTGYVLRQIARQKSLNHPPGAAQSYTNSGYFLLARIIERVSGEPAPAFMKRRIFDPLGMTHSSLRLEGGAVIPRHVDGYRRAADGTWRSSPSGNDNVHTTIGDLVKWNANFARPMVGGEEAIRWMTTWGKLSTGQETEWGLGLSPLRYRGLNGYYFSGGGPDGTSLFARFPDEKTALIVLCNGSVSFNAENLGQRVIDVVLAKEIAVAEAKPAPAQPADPPPVPISAATLQSYAGLYFTTHNGPWSRDFQIRDGKLFLVTSPERSIEMIPLGKGRFRASGSTTEYEFAGNRTRRFATTDPVITFERVDRTPSSDLAELAGTYYNEEIEAGITFSVRDGVLEYRIARSDDPGRLQPVFRDGFRDEALMFRFVRDRNGRVTGVTKHWDRVWNLEYVRR